MPYLLTYLADFRLNDGFIYQTVLENCFCFLLEFAYSYNKLVQITYWILGIPLDRMNRKLSVID